MNMTYLSTSLRKQDGVLEFNCKTFKSLFFSIDFLFELSRAAGNYSGNELKE